MAVYTGLIDGQAGAYGVSFPDLPGCVAMGDTIDEAGRAARVVLSEYVAAMEARRFPLAEPRTSDALMQEAEVADAVAHGATVILIAVERDGQRA